MSRHIEWLDTSCDWAIVQAGEDMGYEEPTEGEVNLYLHNGGDGVIVSGSKQHMLELLERIRAEVEAFVPYVATKAEPGTISHGTLRSQDLVSAFLNTLEAHDKAAAATIVAEYGDTIEWATNLHDGDEPDDMQWLIEALDDALNLVAPDGHRFGAHEGDGSDFGFWPVDDED